jgi:hypothetical protein
MVQEDRKVLTDVNDAQLPLSVPGPASGLPEDDVFAGYVDYYGFDEVCRYYLPDGKQYIEFKPMTEGGRAKYEAKTSRDVRFNRKTDDAAVRMNPADDRHALIVESVTGWHMVRRINDRWQPVAFSKGSKGAELEKWLDVANPKIVNELIDEIRKANPWMTDDMTVEMIDEEIARLQEMRTQVAEREAAGKSS